VPRARESLGPGEDWIDRCETIPVPARTSIRCAELTPNARVVQSAPPPDTTAACSTLPSAIPPQPVLAVVEAKESEAAPREEVSASISEDPVVTTTETIEDPVVTTTETIEDPVVTTTETVEDPVVTTTETIEDPIVTATETSEAASAAVTHEAQEIEAPPSAPAESMTTTEIGDATSTSAHVLPSKAEAGTENEPITAHDDTHSPARESVSPRGFASSGWLLAAAAVAILGVWSLSRANREQAEPAISLAAPAPQPELAEAAQPEAESPAPQRDSAPLQTSASPDREHVQTPVTAPEEPVRLTAYKAVALAGRNAARCRYRGDTPGEIRVVVTFQPNGTVERAAVRQVTSNPMTASCIRSQFSGLTVPAFSGEPIHIATSVTLR
jgi:hypothetical protein